MAKSQSKHKSSSKKTGFKISWQWLVMGIVIIAAIIIVVISNSQVMDNSASKIISSVAVDNSDLKVNWSKYQTVDMALEQSVRITESGTYHLTGTLTDGSITVDAGVGEVRLILDHVSITNSSGSAIICQNAENFVIELVGENYLTDGADYQGYDTDVDGAIYSKADTAFTGSGSLQINANYADGIVSKDDLAIRSGTYIIIAKDDGIRGKDSVYITDGNIIINSTADAIKSTNETDYGKGFILVEGGSINITAKEKGLQAYNNVLLSGGSLTIESNDDAIHSDNYIGLTGGEVAIKTGDDGIHAENELIIDNGTLKINQSYEGIEAKIVTINGGEISVIASDDGINAGGGTDNTTQSTTNPTPNNAPGPRQNNADANCRLTINGGNIYVNSAGDGIDSNGYLIFNGGTVVVNGPTNNGNGALDSGLGITIQGGNVIAIGASGMAESLGSNSNVCNLSIFFKTTNPAGTVIEIRNSAGETVLSHTAAKSFNHLAAGSESLVLGETYTVYLNNVAYQTFTIAEVTTTIGGNQARPMP